MIYLHCLPGSPVAVANSFRCERKRDFPQLESLDIGLEAMPDVSWLDVMAVQCNCFKWIQGVVGSGGISALIVLLAGRCPNIM